MNPTDQNPILITAATLGISLAGWTPYCKNGVTYISRTASFIDEEVILHIELDEEETFELYRGNSIEAIEVGSIQDCLDEANKIAEGYGGWPQPIPAPPEGATPPRPLPEVDLFTRIGISAAIAHWLITEGISPADKSLAEALFNVLMSHDSSEADLPSLAPSAPHPDLNDQNIPRSARIHPIQKGWVVWGLSYGKPQWGKYLTDYDEACQTMLQWCRGSVTPSSPFSDADLPPSASADLPGEGAPQP